MAAEKSEAIVLRTVDFSETSLVVTLFTREFGKIGALAKGGRRPKGPFESALDVLSRCRVVFLHKASDALDLLTEAKLQRRFRPGRDLSGLYAGYYVAELLAGLTHEDDPHPELFDFAEETLVALASDEPVGRRVVRFELGALRLFGHLPSFDACVECTAPVESTTRVPFGLLDGGVLCERCRVGKRQIIAASAGALRTMNQLADAQNDHWQRIQIEANALGEIRGIMNRYLSHLLGKRPRMYDYLSMMWK